MKVKIIQEKVSENQKDSFWYEGQIAIIDTPKWIYSLEAVGDIRINDKNGELVFDGKDRNGGLPVKNDKEISEIEAKGYSWDNNNWFEVVGINKKTNESESIMGDVAYDYDEAIELLKQYAKEKIYEI